MLCPVAYFIVYTWPDCVVSKTCREPPTICREHRTYNKDDEILRFAMKTFMLAFRDVPIHCYECVHAVRDSSPGHNHRALLW